MLVSKVWKPILLIKQIQTLFLKCKAKVQWNKPYCHNYIIRYIPLIDNTSFKLFCLPIFSIPQPGILSALVIIRQTNISIYNLLKSPLLVRHNPWLNLHWLVEFRIMRSIILHQIYIDTPHPILQFWLQNSGKGGLEIPECVLMCYNPKILFGSCTSSKSYCHLLLVMPLTRLLWGKMLFFHHRRMLFNKFFFPLKALNNRLKKRLQFSSHLSLDYFNTFLLIESRSSTRHHISSTPLIRPEGSNYFFRACHSTIENASEES